MHKFLLTLGLTLLNVAARANPFTDGKPAAVSAPMTSALPSPFLSEILALQRQIHEAMTTQLTALRDGDSLAPLWLLLAIGFAYGVFHVLAPGHGKFIVGSYFIGNRARWREAVSAGMVMAIGHTITAVGIVVGLYMVLGVGQLEIMGRARYFELIGYGLISAIGVWLLVRVRRGGKPGCAHCGHHHGHGHDHHRGHHAHDHDHTPTKPQSNRQALSLFGAVSLVPCTGSMIILLFTLAHQILWAGILAVIAIALGMWLTMTLIALAAIFLHRNLAGEEDTPRPWQKRLQNFLRYAAALFVIVTGGALFSGVLLDMMGSVP
jgi:nickel/cobalt transporter (NicO) family protein